MQKAWQEDLPQKQFNEGQVQLDNPILTGVTLATIEEQRKSQRFSKWDQILQTQKLRQQKILDQMQFLQNKPEYLEFLASYLVWQNFLKEAPGLFKKSQEFLKVEALNNLQIEKHDSMPDFIFSEVREVKPPDGYNWMTAGPNGPGMLFNSILFKF